MCKKIISVIAVLIFILLVFNAQIVAKGAYDGLELWLKAVIPALFPFMIISNTVIMSGLAEDMNFIMLPVSKLLRISPSSSYCIMAGLMFGYPSCAISSCEMVKRGIIDMKTAEFCSCCFNNVSPAFIAGYFCNAVVNKPYIAGKVLAVFYLSTMVTSVILRFTIFKNLSKDLKYMIADHCKSKKKCFEKAVMKSLENIGRLGGYILIFSILCRALSEIHLPAPFCQIICSVVEITTGLSKFSNCGLSTDILIMAGIPLMCAGGICGMFQTFGVDTISAISKKKYICSKIISAIVSALITYPAVYVFRLFS